MPELTEQGITSQVEDVSRKLMESLGETTETVTPTDKPIAKTKRVKKANGKAVLDGKTVLKAKDVAAVCGVKPTVLRRKLRKTLYPDGVFTNYLWDTSKASHVTELTTIVGYFGKTWPNGNKAK